jgi:transcription elongation factor Elf1
MQRPCDLCGEQPIVSVSFIFSTVGCTPRLQQTLGGSIVVCKRCLQRFEQTGRLTASSALLERFSALLNALTKHRENHGRRESAAVALVSRPGLQAMSNSLQPTTVCRADSADSEPDSDCPKA